MKADTAWHYACEGTALLWRGDFQNARQMLAAMARRSDRSLAQRAGKGKNAPDPAGAGPFNRYRMAQAQRARVLGMLLVPYNEDFSVALTRAPDVREACGEAWQADSRGSGHIVTSLRELLGIIGAHEWRRRGVEIAALDARIHPWYGVFAPIRSEYVDLVQRAPLPSALDATDIAFDIGTGTGVLAAVLAQRGIRRVIATDSDARALACAHENIDRLGLTASVDVVAADLYPDAAVAPKAGLVVCNPPWIPARPGSPLERAIYDPESRMLCGFLQGLGARLAAGGEGWLVLSDIAEHLGLRTRAELLAMFESAALRVADRLDARPQHPRASDATDPLHAARRAELTSLWRLQSAK